MPNSPIASRTKRKVFSPLNLNLATPPRTLFSSLENSLSEAEKVLSDWKMTPHRNDGVIAAYLLSIAGQRTLTKASKHFSVSDKSSVTEMVNIGGKMVMKAVLPAVNSPPHKVPKILAHTHMKDEVSAQVKAEAKEEGNAAFKPTKIIHKTELQFFSDCTSVKETISSNPSGAKTSLVHAGANASYVKLVKVLSGMKLKHKLKNDAVVAQSIFDIMNKKKPQFIEKSDDMKALKVLGDVCYLLFSTEVNRHKSALISGCMFLDLVISGTYTMKNLLDLPMSMHKAVPASRRLDDILEPLIVNHQRYDNGATKVAVDSEEFRSIIRSHYKLLVDWLSLKGLVIDGHNTLQKSCIKISSLVSKAIKGWFKVDISEIKNTLTPNLQQVKSDSAPDKSRGDDSEEKAEEISTEGKWDCGLGEVSDDMQKLLDEMPLLADNFQPSSSSAAAADG